MKSSLFPCTRTPELGVTQFLIHTHTADGFEIQKSHHFETMVDISVCWYLLPELGGAIFGFQNHPQYGFSI